MFMFNDQIIHTGRKGRCPDFGMTRLIFQIESIYRFPEGVGQAEGQVAGNLRGESQKDLLPGRIRE
jgi:hypothetical protein